MNSVNEVKSHAYSVIGVHDLTLSTRKKLKLIKMFNPWGREVWKENPWADTSSLWTTEIKEKVGMVSADEGVFFVTPEDYLKNFERTNWGKVRPDYDVEYIDVPIDNVNLNTQQTINVLVKIANNVALLPVMVYIDLPTTRLEQKCDHPLELSSFWAFDAKKQIISPTNFGEYVVSLYYDGTYNFTAKIINKKSFNRYITITAYRPRNITFSFLSQIINKQDNVKNCLALKNCSGNGKCNFYSGTCICFRGVIKNKILKSKTVHIFVL